MSERQNMHVEMHTMAETGRGKGGWGGTVLPGSPRWPHVRENGTLGKS